MSGREFEHVEVRTDREKMEDAGAPDMTGWSPQRVRKWLETNPQPWFVRDGNGVIVTPNDEFVLIDEQGNEVSTEEWVRLAEAGHPMFVRLRPAQRD